MAGICSLSSANLWQRGGRGYLILLTYRSGRVKPLSCFYSDKNLHTFFRCIKLGKRLKNELCVCALWHSTYYFLAAKVSLYIFYAFKLNLQYLSYMALDLVNDFFKDKV